MNSPINDEQQFRLVFPGNILPGTDFDEVVFDLARLLKTTPDNAIKLVSGKKRYVKRDFLYEKADQLRVQVLQIGVECELEAVKDEASSPKRKKRKRASSFPKPEKMAMQPARSADGSEKLSLDPDDQAEKNTAAEYAEKIPDKKGYSETMAEFERHANDKQEQNIESDLLDESFLSFNAEGKDAEAESKQPSSVKSDTMRRRLAQFVGVNLDAYLPKFDKFQQGGTPHFVFTWHWPAFFVPFFWAIYRKLWVWSVIILVSGIFLPLVSNLVWGSIANYIYYRHSLKKINKIRQAHLSNELDELVPQAGGTSVLSLSVSLLIILLLMNGVYWTSKFSPLFTTLSENLENIQQVQSKSPE